MAATFECAIADGHGLADIDDSEFSVCSSPFTPTLSDGEYTFAVRGTNSGGADPTPAKFEFELDTDAPDGVIVSGPTGLINDRTPTFEVSTDEPFDIPEGEFDMSCNLSGALTTSFPCIDAPFEFPQPLPDGNYTLTLQVQDLLGRQDATPATQAFTVDGTRPDTLITTGPSGTIADSTPSFGFSSGEAGSSFECKLDDDAFAACTSPRTVAALGEGSRTFQVRATDPAGNVDASPASRTVNVVLDKCGGRTPTLIGTEGADVINGTGGVDVVVALGGKDKVEGLGAGDFLCGGGGNDILIGGGGADKLFGQASRDKLRGGPGRDKLRGGPGRDIQRQ